MLIKNREGKKPGVSGGSTQKYKWKVTCVSLEGATSNPPWSFTYII